jgi:hypothetical protein
LNESIRLEPGVRVPEVIDRPAEQARRRHEHEAERKLRGHEHAA